MNSTNPIADDVDTISPIANFAALELPLPSSFETRTLEVLNIYKFAELVQSNI